MAKMTPRTLSGFMELLAPQKASLSPGTPWSDSNRPK